MLGDIEVDDAAAVVADDEETVEHVEGERRHGEEAHRSDSLAVIAQKGQPTLAGLRMSGRSPHPAGDGGLRHVETEHQKFAVDARRAPGRILDNHAEDQLVDLFGDSPATADSFSRLAEHRPVQPEPTPVPPSHRFWQNENQRFFPSRPESACHNPEQLVQWT